MRNSFTHGLQVKMSSLSEVKNLKLFVYWKHFNSVYFSISGVVALVKVYMKGELVSARAHTHTPTHTPTHLHTHTHIKLLIVSVA